jgi:hypothetical protein
MATCANCYSADPRRPGSKLCDACYMAKRRGRPRTEDNIIKHNRRRFEQDAQRRWAG